MKDETLVIHGGFIPDGNSGAVVVPIYQTTSYSCQTAQGLADIFQGKTPGHTYSRISNPTTSSLESRLTQLEDGIGCIVTSSGMAAIASAVMGLVKTGDQVIVAKGIFGGTVSLFKNILSRFGVETVWVDASDTDNVAKSVNSRTKLIFVETIGNPRMDVPDIPAIALVAHSANIPLIVDNTVATPVLFKPGAVGADIVIHSASKFINGHGNAIGGAVIDTGNYNWRKGIFSDIKKLSEKVGQLAFLSHLRNNICRDLGCCLSPVNAFFMLEGIETLSVRITKHCQNTQKLAEYLKNRQEIAWVNYPALIGARFYERVQRFFKGRGGGLLTFGLGTKERAFKFIDSLKLAKNLANLGDAKTLVIHPASTIFHEFEAAEKEKMGVTEDMIRVSVGIEDFEDIKADFEQAIEKIS